MKRIIVLVMVLAMLAISFAGCSASGEQASVQTSEAAQASDATQSETITLSIGAIPQDPSVEFYTKMVEGYQDGAEEMGVTLSVQYSNNNVEEETRLTEAYISQGVDGVIVNPIDSVAIVGPIQKAKTAGVPIVLSDVAPAEDPGATSIVTSDNYAGGYAAGQMMIELVGAGEIIMTKFKYSAVAMDDRYQGFQDAIEGSDLVLVDTIECDGTREDTLAKITPMLSKYPNLAGIFCSQGDPAIGCLSAVDTANMSDQVKIISYDVESEVAEAIKQGSAIVGGVTQFPYVMGYEAVRQLVRAIRGEEYETLIELPVLPVTQDNVQELIDDPVAFLLEYGDYDLAAGA